ncbi:hypothetical protein P7K49_018916, partial [Saguinus oedipus]
MLQLHVHLGPPGIFYPDPRDQAELPDGQRRPGFPTCAERAAGARRQAPPSVPRAAKHWPGRP